MQDTVAFVARKTCLNEEGRCRFALAQWQSQPPRNGRTELGVMGGALKSVQQSLAG